MYKLKQYITALLIVIFLIGLQETSAQVKVHVMSRKINKSINWKPGMTFWLTGERAEIFCTTHQENTIDFEIEIISKNEDKKIAEADLDKMKLVDQVNGKKVSLRNYVELNRRETKPESDLKVIYHIKVPENCKVFISNYFGKTRVIALKSSLTINSKFSPVKLQNIAGNITINSNFGDISIDSIYGTVTLQTTRSDISIRNFSGLLDIHSDYATILLSKIYNLTKAAIHADKSNINLKTGDYNRYSYFISTTDSKIIKPDKMHPDIFKEEETKTQLRFNAKTNKPQITIELNMGILTIEN